jgi:hypothetical protein
VNLFETARANDESLKTRFEALLADAEGDSRDALQRFSERVERDGRISLNMRLSGLLGFLVADRHQNIHEWATEEAGLTGRPKDEVLQEKLGPYCPRRVAFDGHFEDGEQFRYGSLNIGGAGLSHYGEFCSVLGVHVSVDRAEVAYLKGDSLETYVSADGTVDDDAVREDAASHNRRQCLATLKLSEAVPTTPPETWDSLLCSDDRNDFVEAVFTGETRPADVETVRIGCTDHDRYFDDLFESTRGTLGDADGRLVDLFIRVTEMLADRGLALEVVGDA